MGSERLRRKGERHISLLLPLSLILTIWGNFNESVWQIKIQIISSDSTLTVAKMKRTGSEAAKKGKDPALEPLKGSLAALFHPKLGNFTLPNERYRYRYVLIRVAKGEHQGIP